MLVCVILMYNKGEMGVSQVFEGKEDILNMLNCFDA